MKKPNSPIFKIITIFPEIITDYLRWWIVSQGLKNNLFKVETFNLRDFSLDKQKRVDLKMYGNEHGQVLECNSFFRCLNYLLLGEKNKLPEKINKKYSQTIKEKKEKEKIIIVNLSPVGKTFSNFKAKKLAKQYQQIILLCGRYEGIDQRIIDTFVDQEISIGKYILAGGELPALVLLESIIRQIPGVIKNIQSVQEETFSLKLKGKKEYPLYTRPQNYHGLCVPKILLEWNHAKIEEWKKKNLRK